MATTNTKRAPQPLAERPHKGLTPTQEELAELAADILLNGGARTDVAMFLTAVSRHWYRRFLTTLSNFDNSEKEVDGRGGQRVERWYRQLAKEWPEETSPKQESSASASLKTVSDIARADIRGQVQDQFEQFMATTDGIESVYLLNEILGYTTCSGYDMAAAFAKVMAYEHTYVRVPWDLEEEVKKFISLLEKRAA